MTALLPPNLLRLFAPRPQPPYLKPLTKEPSIRGPDKLDGISSIVKRLREEAEEAEYQEGLEDKPKVKAEEDGEDKKAETQQMDVDGEDGEVKEVLKKEVPKGKGKKKDPIAAAGVIGQEAVKMRRELRKKRKEEYKTSSEKQCEWRRTSVSREQALT